MKHIILRFFILVLVSMTTSSFGQENTFSKVYHVGSKLYVHAGGGLALRENPDTKAAMVTLVKFGESVIVIADSHSRVNFTVSGIAGTWVKVRYGMKEGYQFDGFLSRWQVIGKESIDSYLQSKFKIISQSDTPPDTGKYNMYRKISFENDISFLWSAPIGSNTISVRIPAERITFQEIYLLAREAYPDAFKECPFKEGNMNCSIDDNSSVSLYKQENYWLIENGTAD